MGRFKILLAATLAICRCASCSAADNSVPTLAQQLSNLPSDSSVLEIPEGTYTIDTTLVVSKPAVTIRGAGPGKTVLMRASNFDGVLVRMDGESSTLSNLTLDGNGTRTVLSLTGTGVTADTIEVKNFTHIGITVPASGCRITKCLVSGLGTADAPSMGIWHYAGKSLQNQQSLSITAQSRTTGCAASIAQAEK